MCYLIRQIFERDGDEVAIWRADDLAEELKRFGWKGVGATVRNHIKDVEKLFRKHFGNPKLKLFESILSKGLSIVLSVEWDKGVGTAWRLIEQVGGTMHELAARRGRVDKK
jgi:hypothetical protein